MKEEKKRMKEEKKRMKEEKKAKQLATSAASTPTWKATSAPAAPPWKATSAPSAPNWMAAPIGPTIPFTAGSKMRYVEHVIFY